MYEILTLNNGIQVVQSIDQTIRYITSIGIVETVKLPPTPAILMKETSSKNSPANFPKSNSFHKKSVESSFPAMSKSQPLAEHTEINHLPP